MKTSKLYTSSPIISPIGKTGAEYADEWCMTAEEAYAILAQGDYYMTGYDDNGYHSHFVTGNEERGDTKHVILSTAILIEDGVFTRQALTMDEAKEWCQAKAPTNFCGHETVRILGYEPDRSRRSCESYDQALCLSANSRLEFGREYTLEEIEEIGVTVTLVTKMKSL